LAFSAAAIGAAGFRDRDRALTPLLTGGKLHRNRVNVNVAVDRPFSQPHSFSDKKNWEAP
jgi:hypothetical protein